MKVADQRRLTVIGNMDLHLQIGQQSQEITVVAVLEKLPFYIDYTTLKAFRLVIDPEMDTLMCKTTGEQIPFIGLHSMDKYLNTIQVGVSNEIELISNKWEIDEEHKHKLNKIMHTHIDCFQDLSIANVSPIEIPMINKRPISSKLRSCTVDQDTEIENQ